MSNQLPKVSILVAARNEGLHLGACLDALLAQTYPAHLLEIWVGDDASEDNTFSVATQLALQNPCIHVMQIPQTTSLTKGKANVLAHLAKKASASLWAFVDADVVVPPGWLAEMVKHYQPNNLGILVGFTAIRPTTWFSKFQALDWLYALSALNLAAFVKLPVTAMGNNMLVNRTAYLDTGGYETIPFSVAEDYALFTAIIAKGYSFGYLMNTKAMAYTYAMPDFISLLQQRKRWMHGAISLPWYLIAILWMQAFFFPASLLLLTFSADIFWGSLAAKYFVETIWAALLIARFQPRDNLWLILPFYGMYMPLLTLATVLFYFLPVKTIWKGRAYQR